MLEIAWLDEDDDLTPFPPVEFALEEPNGLLAVGGALSPHRLEMAYRSGIFPWFSDDQPVLWWSPDPRALLFPAEMHRSRSLRKRIRSGFFDVTLDQAFDRVIRACAGPRPDQPGTWITEGMIRAYETLHRRGIAHSVEVWRAGALQGGLYGVALGGAFFGESMFSQVSDASKVALAWLAAQLLRWDYRFVDCQLPSAHLQRLGARNVPRWRFIALLEEALQQDDRRGPWQFDAALTASEVALGQ